MLFVENATRVSWTYIFFLGWNKIDIIAKFIVWQRRCQYDGLGLINEDITTDEYIVIPKS